jgi:TonB-dependent Receptor Plug Domain
MRPHTWLSAFAFAVASLAADAAPTAHDLQTQVASEGRRLDEVLAELQRDGLKLIFSSEVVRPTMRVRVEPRRSSPRRMLDALLEPHGLIARDGPAGTVLVVKNPRARLDPRVPPAADKPPAFPRPPQSPHTFAETIQVTDDALMGRVEAHGVQVLGGRDVRDIAGGFDNAFRTLTALPGVVPADELGSRMAVRGGAPDQNLTIMDGIEVHNPFRLVVPAEDLALVGLASTFNPDIVDRVEFHPGAFDVGYGDRLSSVLVVSNREGSQATALQGAFSMNLGSASLTLEGRLPKGADGSWLVSARRSYLGALAQPIANTTVPTFTDVHARATWLPRPGRRLSVVALGGRERLRPPRDAAADAGASAAADDALLGVTFETSLGRRGLWRSVASYSRFSDTLDAFERSLDNSRGANSPESIASGGSLAFVATRRIGVADFALRQDVWFAPSARHQINIGVDVHDLDTRWMWDLTGDRNLHQANGSSLRLGAALPRRLDSDRRTRRTAAWIAHRWHAARLAVEPGVRLDYSTLTGRRVVSPRLGVTAALSGGWQLDGAIRLHAQSPGYEKMLQSDYFVNLSEEVSLGLKPERALQAVAGVQRAWPLGFTVRVETYYKRYTDLLGGRLETDAESTARLDDYDVPVELWPYVRRAAEITTAPVNDGRGYAYGVEAFVSRKSAPGSPLAGWVSYSFGRSRRTEYGVTRPFDYDRRHAVTAAGALRLGPRWDLSLTARVASGLPRTPSRGVRLSLVEDAADVDGDGNRAEKRPLLDATGLPVFQPDYGDVSNLSRARLPHFARVDARLTYRPPWAGERWAFYLDVVNLLNSRNITQIDTQLVYDPGAVRPRLLEVAHDRGIPLFPSIGVRFWF